MIEDFEETQQALTFTEGVNAFEPAVGFDLGVGEW